MFDFPVLVIDLEATCSDDGAIDELSMETIEIGACFVNGDGIVLGSFQSFVRPIQNPELTNFCVQLTGIRQENVDSAPSFAIAADLLAQFVGRHKTSETIWFSWGKYDLKQIARDSIRHGIPNPIELPHQNAKRLFAKAQRIGKEVGMSRACQMVGLEIEGAHHRALDDALNIARLLPWVHGDKFIKRAG